MEQGTPTNIPTRDVIHAGLQHISRAKQLLGDLAGPDDGCAVAVLLGQLAECDDPDTALANLVDIRRALDERGEPLSSIVADEAQMTRLIGVLGASNAMGTLMRFRPDLVRAAVTPPRDTAIVTREARRARILDAVGADPASAIPVAGKVLAEAAGALRADYREQLAAIMAQDVTAGDPIEIQPKISAELSDLADAALEGALAIARREVAGSEHVRFAVIGMGKLGARELNYVSDVDLIYVVEPADDHIDNTALTRIGTKIATTLQRVCQSVVAGVAEQPLWQIDGALRPEGKDGPLVRRLEEIGRAHV